MEPPPYRFVELAVAPRLERTDMIVGLDDYEEAKLVEHWDDMVWFAFPSLRYARTAPFNDGFLLFRFDPVTDRGVVTTDTGEGEWEAFVSDLVESLPGQSANTRDYLLTHLPMNSVAGMVELCEQVSKHPKPLPPGIDGDEDNAGDSLGVWIDGRGRKAYNKLDAAVDEFFHEGHHTHTHPDGDDGAHGQAGAV